MRKNLFLHFLLSVALLSCTKATSKTYKVIGGEQNPNLRSSEIVEDDSVVILPSFPKSEAEIASLETQAMTETTAAYDAIAALAESDLNFQVTFKALDTADANFWQLVNRINIVGDLGEDSVVRDAAKATASRLEGFINEQALRADVYANLKKVADSFVSISVYDRRLVELYMRSFKKNGAEGTDEEKAKIAAVKKEITDAKEAYDKGLSMAGAKKLLLTPTEAALLPDFIQAMIKKYETTDGFDIPRGNLNVWSAIMTYADDEALREKAWTNRYSFAKDDATPASLTLVNKRKELAGLLGYSSWAAHQTDGRMADKPENVEALYAKVIAELAPIKTKETEKFTTLKQTLTGDAAAVLRAWDLPYLEQKIRQSDFNYDAEALRAYFPLEKVRAGTFDVYGKVYGVEFTQYEDAYDTWFPGVELYMVRDADTQKILGVLYLDLFARAEQGKRTGAWMNQVLPGQVVGGISYRPTVQVVTNFRPIISGDVDSYMSFDEMNTFFHEFGHAMHSLVSSVPHASITIDGVAWDFVEAPSQIMEDFLGDYKVVSLLSAHKESGEPLPEATLKSINDSGKISTAYYWTRQIALGQLDWTLYHRDISTADMTLEEMITASDANLDQYWIDVPEGLGFVGAFSHVNSGGYSAGYYSYLWAAVVAADCSESFKNSSDGYLNPTLGKKWRDEVLSQGAAKDASELVKAFLGREYTIDAFIRSLN